MRKEEFEKLIKKEVREEEYKIIEFVYMWHPSISETRGKEQIANLYSEYGMAVITGMVPLATYCKIVEDERNCLKKDWMYALTE